MVGRRKYLSLPGEDFERLNEHRKELGLSWRDYFIELLESYQEETDEDDEDEDGSVRDPHDDALDHL